MVNILVYHDIGIGKHVRMGTEYNPQGIRMDAPDETQLQIALEIFKAKGLNAIIGG